jgi:hypothetical protein
LCGDLVSLCEWLPDTEAEGEAMDIEEVEEALECVWWW